jgi:hypothetical protein
VVKQILTVVETAQVAVQAKAAHNGVIVQVDIAMAPTHATCRLATMEH